MNPKQHLGEETKLLVSILAAVDTLFAPMRGTYKDPPPMNACDAEIFHRRIDYIEGQGLLWRVGGNMADRQHGSRLLQRLQEGGLLQMHGDDRRRHIRLTPLGDDVARQVSGGHTLFSCWPTFTEIARGVREQIGVNCWILERQLLPAAPTSKDIRESEDALAPYLAGGLLTSTRDTRGEECYTVTDAGWNRLDGPRPELTDGIDFNPVAGEWFNAEFRRLYAVRDTWRPEKNVCFIPFPPLVEPQLDWIPTRTPLPPARPWPTIGQTT